MKATNRHQSKGRQSAPDVPRTQTAIFARNGEYWTIGYLGTTFSLRDLKGLRYLQRLVRHPGEEFHALDLLSEPGTSAPTETADADSLVGEPNVNIGGLGDAGPMLDARAKQEYRRRLLELREQVEDLRERGDHERALEVESEIEFLEREIVRAVGLGGRDRRAGSASERARLNVTRAIRAAFQKIAEHDASLGKLLERSIRTGSFCRYVADPQVPINWQFSLQTTGTPAETEPAAPILTEAGLREFADQTKFVGREAECAALRRHLDPASRGEPRVIMIGGEAGVGKTRLARQVAAEASHKGFLVLAGGCYDREDPVPFSPLVEMIEALAQGAEPAALREMLGEDAAEVARLMPHLRRLFSDIPPPQELSPEQSRQALFAAVSGLLARAAGNRPVLLLFEDLHWADEGALSLLSYLARGTSGLPMIIVGTYRDSELDPAGTLAKTLDEFIRFRMLERINLRGLPENAVAEMIRALSAQQPPQDLAALFYYNTEGNPFFIEELFRHLVEQGQLTDSNGQLRRNLKLAEIDVPPTLRLVIGRRLARLSKETLAVLGFAAVVGRSFTFELLEAASGKDEEWLLDRVEEAERKGVISSALHHPAPQFRFFHELVRNAVLEGLSLARRQRMHLRVANAIEKLHGDAIEDHANDLAYHLLQAGPAIDDPGRIVLYLAMAARREILQSAYQSALNHLKTGLELVSKLPATQERDRTELNLLMDYGLTVIALKGWYQPEVGDAYKRARELCIRLGDSQKLLSVLSGLAVHHLNRAELKLSRADADEMNLLSSAPRDEKLILVGWSAGNAQFFMGEFGAAHESYRQVVSCYERPRHRRLAFLIGQDPCVSSLNYDALTLLILGFPDQAERRLQESLSLARDLGHPFTLAVCLTLAAKYCCLRRDFDRLPEFVRETTGLSHDYGFTMYEEGIAVYEIIGLASQKKIEELRASLARSKRFSEIRYELASTWSRSTLAEALANLGRIRPALALLSEASQMMIRNDERYVESEIIRIRGVLALKQIDEHERTADERQSAQAQAERTFREAKAIARGQGAKLFELRAATDLSRLLVQLSRSDEARTILGETYNSFAEGFDVPDLQIARSVLEELGGAGTRQAPVERN